MKKILMVVLLSVITSMTIYFMAFWQPNKNINNNLLLEDKSKEKNNYENKEKYNNFENKDIENTNSKDQKKKVKTEKDNNKKNSEIENKEKNYNINIERNNDSNIEEKDKVANSNVQIFNVKKEEIISSLNIKEKSKIILIMSKLSSVDTERIKEILNEKGEKEGAKEVVRLLKLRLVEEDYNDIKDILSPYINIGFLEELI